MGERCGIDLAFLGGPAEERYWLRVRGYGAAIVNGFINSNTYKFYVEYSQATPSQLHFFNRVPERLNVGQDFSERERIINGGAQLASIGVTTVGDDAYFAHQWYALSQSNNIAYSIETDPENGQAFCHRLTQSNASSQRMGAAQIIESLDCRDLRGQECNFQARIRCSTSQAIRFAILSWSGTADSVTSDVVSSWTSGQYRAGGFFNSTTLAVVRVGRIFPSTATWADFSGGTIRFVAPTNANNLIVVIWTEDVAAQNVTLDWGAVSLKRGGQKIKYEPPPISQELARASRLFLRIAAGDTRQIALAQCASTTAAVALVQFPVSMRIAPALVVSDVSHFGVTNAGGTVQATSNLVIPGSISPSTDRASLTATVASGLIAGDIGQLRTNNSSAAIAFDARL